MKKHNGLQKREKNYEKLLIGWCEERVKESGVVGGHYSKIIGILKK